MARQTRSRRKTKKSGTGSDGEPSRFTCPDCQGTLFLLRTGNLVRFRCRIGHLYSPESMMEAQDENVERLMWSATRALEEQAEYIHQMAEQIAKGADHSQSRQYASKSRAASQKAGALRKLLTIDPAGRVGARSS
jgi:two-component system chemotaxis response regulator CheB